jgi:hypothetical protein
VPITSDPKVLQETPAATFFDFVRDALGSRHVDASPDTEFYLVHLLSGFVRSQPESLSRALGPELIAATRLDPAGRSVRLKQLGDTTLFLAGIFLDYIESRPAATEYYFTIGKTAYGRLAEMTATAGGSLGERANTFRDLSRRFVEFVHVLAVISDKELFAGSERLMGIYERWLDSRNPRDASRLISAGIIASGGGSRIH